MHAGDKPYVVASTGQVDLATRGLSLDAVDGIVAQLLSADSRAALEEFGAVHYELPSDPEFPAEHFTVVAARGGDDLWVEVRRHRIVEEDHVPEEFFTTPAATPRHVPAPPPPPVVDDVRPEPIVAAVPAPIAEVEPIVADEREDLLLPDAAQFFAAEPEPVAIEERPKAKPAAVVTPLPPDHTQSPPSQRTAPAPPPQRAAPPPPELPSPQPAVVLPMMRNPIRVEPHAAVSIGDPTMDGLQRLLRISAARGASTLYLSSNSQPSVRVDADLQMLDSEPVLTERDVESLLLTLMPERSHEALRTGAPSEWICDIEEVGRVRCTTFHDHIGPGGVFRLMPSKTVTAEQLGLPKAIQALAIEPEGVILVVGPRSSGKQTLMSAFVDLINHTRRDHVITIEREISIVHPRGSSFISQREVRGNDDDLLTASRAALREDPDVLVIEDLRTGPLMNVALEAASSGRLVIGGFSAHTATQAIDRIIDLYAPEHRRHVQLAIADNLRGVISQVLVRKIGGGRTPAREILLNTPAVSSVIAEGKTSSLPMAIEGGRRYGMLPLSDSLIALVHSGVVDAREAYRHASDHAGLLAALKRQGIDTSFVERLA
jgi:twitching motility protein PilT